MIKSAFLAAAAMALACPALADVIDGNWCTRDGKQFLTIDGPKMVTPGGKSIIGDYDRHSFIYVVPPAETGAGNLVLLTLINEQTMFSQAGDSQQTARSAPRLEWNRCQRPIM